LADFSKNCGSLNRLSKRLPKRLSKMSQTFGGLYQAIGKRLSNRLDKG
jgi:tetrahydromethanopterin S-methyltransferase subunit G